MAKTIRIRYKKPKWTLWVFMDIDEKYLERTIYKLESEGYEVK